MYPQTRCLLCLVDSVTGANEKKKKTLLQGGNCNIHRLTLVLSLTVLMLIGLLFLLMVLFNRNILSSSAAASGSIIAIFDTTTGR